MADWLLKTEPETFSWDDQVKRGGKGEPWTGVRNYRAREHLKAMRLGDHAFFYHTGDEKQVVGIVDVKAVRPLPKPVTLKAVKADRRLKDMVLAKQPRLSVQPVTADEWRIVCSMGGIEA